MGLVKKFKVGVFPVKEGVLVRGRNHYDVAIKKSNGNILLDKGNIKFISRLPIIFIRGIISAIENGALWVKMLLYAAGYFDAEEVNEADMEFLSKEEYLNKQDKLKAEHSQSWLIFSVMLILLILATIGFFVIPVYVARMFFDNVREENWLWFNTIRYCFGIVLLYAYLIIFKLLGGVFASIRQYNAAAKKAMNCFEAGQELTLENVKRASSVHPRSLTYILALTVILYSVANIFIRLDNLFISLLIRLGILLASVGVSYEISRLFGMFNGKFSRVLAMIFGMWVEYFTVDKPNDIQIYIAMAGIENAMIEED